MKRNELFTYKGVTGTLRQLSDRFGVDYFIVLNRKSRGDSIERMFRPIDAVAVWTDEEIATVARHKATGRGWIKRCAKELPGRTMNAIRQRGLKLNEAL